MTPRQFPRLAISTDQCITGRVQTSLRTAGWCKFVEIRALLLLTPQRPGLIVTPTGCRYLSPLLPRAFSPTGVVRVRGWPEDELRLIAEIGQSSFLRVLRAGLAFLQLPSIPATPARVLILPAGSRMPFHLDVGQLFSF